MLTIHGVTEHGRIWHRLAHHLPEIPIAAPDLLGHGRSPWAAPWTIDANVSALAALLDNQGDGPVVVVGHSFGGAVAMHLAAVVVVGVLVLVGGIAAFSAQRLSQGNFVVLSPTPSVSRAVPTPTAQPATTLPPAGASLSVSGVNVNRTIACNDSIVSVSGMSNTVVITGHCTSLTVSGMRNSVTVDSVDTIEAAGFNNEVTYHSGSPKISNAGGSNSVQQG